MLQEHREHNRNMWSDQSPGLFDRIGPAGSDFKYGKPGFPGITDCNRLGKSSPGIAVYSRILSWRMRRENRREIPGCRGFAVTSGNRNEGRSPKKLSQNNRNPQAGRLQERLGCLPYLQKITLHGVQDCPQFPESPS